MNAKALVLLTITASFAIAATLQPAHLFKPSSNFFKASDRSWLDRKATEALYKTKELIPEAITTYQSPQKDDDQDSTILSSMYRIVKQLITGSTRALEIVQNVKYLEDLPSVLKSKSTLFVIVSNGAPLTSRKLNDPIIRFGESSSFWSRNSRPAPVASKFFETVLVPKMNALALEFEKRIQLSRSTNHTFATVSIRAMPDELQVNDLLAIYSLSTGNLFIHPRFFDAMQHMSNFVPLDSIDATFSQLRDALPSKIFSIDALYSLVAHAPLLLFSNFGMSLVCVACLAGLSLLTPFVLNYLLFELANVLCSTLQLQQEVCISVELGSLMLAYVMIYPAAMVIFYMCKRFVCAASGRFIFQY